MYFFFFQKEINYSNSYFHPELEWHGKASNYSCTGSLKSFYLSNILILVFVIMPVNTLQLNNCGPIFWDTLDRRMLCAHTLRCSGLITDCLGYPALQQLSPSYHHHSIRELLGGLGVGRRIHGYNYSCYSVFF